LSEPSGRRRPDDMRGHVRKRGRKWAVVVDAGADPVTGRRRQRWHSGFRTRKEAEAELAAILTRLDAGAYAEPSKQTVAAYLEQWLSAQRPRLRPSTHESYRRVLRVHVIPAIGSTPLMRLTATVLDELYAALLREGRCDGTGGLSARTVRYVHTIIRRALSDAVRKGLVSRNVAALADPPSPSEAKAPTMRTWTAAELSAFLEHVRDDRLAAAWKLLATTGARRGEVLGARWRDIDLDAGRWSVVQTITTAGVSRPKGGRARSVALDAGTVQSLRAHRKAQAAERLAWGPAYVDADLVFCREDGTPLEPRTFSRMFARHVAAAALPRIRLHDLRHTWASLALGAGVHPKIVSERLGHASIAITLDVYSHVSAGMQQDAAETVAALVRIQVP
jgi:integrase